MVGKSAFSWCFCFLFSWVSSCCCWRFCSKVKFGCELTTSLFCIKDCNWRGSKFNGVFWDGESCRGCLLVG